MSGTDDGGSQGIMAGRKGFMAEGKPGFPDVYDQRVLNNEQRKNELLTEENERLRKEIGRLNFKIRDLHGLVSLAVKEVFAK